jgi:hypothetical protein
MHRHLSLPLFSTVSCAAAAWGWVDCASSPAPYRRSPCWATGPWAPGGSTHAKDWRKEGGDKLLSIVYVVHIFKHVHNSAYTHTHIHTYTHTHIHTYTYTYTYTHIQANTNKNTNTNTQHICTYIIFSHLELSTSFTSITCKNDSNEISALLNVFCR